MKRVLIVPPHDLTLQRSDGINHALYKANIMASICREDQQEVRGVDIMLVLLGKKPNFPLLRRMGEAARNAEVPIVYADADSVRIVGVVVEALHSSDLLLKTGS
ncbi:MAG: hypothetical protein KGH79_03545 [Patescibacteria group bacterium]|nr:hypothetical protein [Patescibacteria group bacterium]